MGIRQFKPVTKSSRFRSVSDFAEITTTTPEKSLLEPIKKSRRPRQSRPHRDASPWRWPQAAVPHHRFQAQQARRSPARCTTIEYDPNRSARIALVTYADGEKRYIIHPKGLSGRRHDHGRPGLGHPHRQRAAARRDAARYRGAQRRAEDRQGRAALPLGGDVGAGRREGRRVRHAAHAVDGNAPGARRAATRRSATVGNEEHELISWGKAGKTRWKGRRPKVRGEVMNPVDHPHGGRTRGGRNVVSPWGKKEGVKTRNKKKSSQRLIVRGRKRGKATQ